MEKMMKKIKLLAVVAILAISTSAFAQAYDLPLMFGVEGGWHQNTLNAEYNSDAGTVLEGETEETVTSFYQIQAFFDASYFRVCLGYSGSIGDTVYSTSISGDEDVEADYSLGIIEISAYFKYPIYSGYENAVFYPMIGINYSSLYSATWNDAPDGVDEDIKKDLQDNEYEDLYLMLGFGGDFKVSETVFIVPSVLFGINLTADDDDDTTDATFSYKFGINCGVGFKL